MNSGQYKNDELIFLEEDVDVDGDLGETEGFWNILVVDDDEEIHSITKLALSDLVLDKRELNFYHAYSGKEAMELLAQYGNDIAIVLLDVVMETDNAGLDVAKALRSELNLHETRIVLRTGQPGYAPEDSVIKEYDINDYKTKTELTRSRLVTTIISSLRSYQQLRKITRSRQGLENIIQGTPQLMEQRTQLGFCRAALKQIGSLLDIPADGMIFSMSARQSVQIEDIHILGSVGKFEEIAATKLHQVGDSQIVDLVESCFTGKQHQITPHGIALYLCGAQRKLAIYLDVVEMLDPSVMPLIDVLLSSISVGLENVTLLHRLEEAAYRDWLTKLANRNEFINILDRTRIDCEGQAIAFVDIKHFSDINDGLGQEVGNQLLIDVGRRLTTEFGNKVTLGRIDADVFGLLGSDKYVRPDIISELFSYPFIVGEHTLPVSVRIGLSGTCGAEMSSMEILKRANIALNEAKKHVTQNHMYFSQAMEEETAQRLGIIRQLRADFSDKRLELWYQPQLCLISKKVIGVEALLRWPTRDGRYISPAEFIPLAEYSGLIIKIGGWVLSEACKKLQVLNNAGYANMRMAVNISMPQFRNQDFVRSVKQAVQEHDIQPEALELEITESILMDEPERVVDSLASLKSFGVKVAIDDFGTGFSSMSYLNKLPIDRLKIDREFVSQYETGKSAVIAENIIILGKKLGLQTIAEGIETQEQAEYFSQLGCDEAQGYLYAKPMGFDELQRFLAEFSAL